MITSPEGDGGGPAPRLATIYYLNFQFSTKNYDMQRKREVWPIDDKYQAIERACENDHMSHLTDEDFKWLK